jgi:predicted ATPase
MKAERWQQISHLYDAALACDGGQRAAFLREACAGDLALQREVESLLRHGHDAEIFLQRPALEIAAEVTTQAQQRSIAGRRLGPYEIISSIGAGGMGEVYKAQDTRLKRPVAIKILSPEFSRDHDRRTRFGREAQAIAALNHPHICVVHDVGHQDGVDYLVMEYLDGETLRERLAQGPLAVHDAKKIAVEVAEALSQAHQRGIVHRDVKPGNIMLTMSGTKLLDFGLAKVVRSDDLASSDFDTVTGVVLGTATYMSPEHLLGLTIDPRSDVFSVGVVLYEMVTGARPFRGANVIETIDAILHNQPDPILKTRHIPQELEEVIFRCLEKERDKRYKSAEELITALRTGQPYSERGAGQRSNPRHNLPIQLTSFVGRDTEIGELRKLLGDVRLVTLVGPGGIGKTRLALQVASQAPESFVDGLCFAEFASLSDPEIVPQTVASALGVLVEPGQAPIERLTDYLKPRHLLLVLDNCEHLIEACAHLAHTLLRVCPDLRVLSTSREALNIEGEVVWRVPSLSSPDYQQLPPIETLTRHEAVRLFLERAVAVTPAFRITNENALALCQICHRLDGIPLAIELAAASLKVMSVSDIWAKLTDRFELLTRGGSRTALPRQRTLRAAIDWSHDLLTEPERVLFRRLAVFRGGWNREYAQGVCSDEGMSEELVDESLFGLIDKSLVLIEDRTERTRYYFLETIRHYAEQRLSEAGETTTFVARHRQFFLSVAETKRKESLIFPDWSPLQPDVQNFRRALLFFRTSG